MTVDQYRLAIDVLTDLASGMHDDDPLREACHELNIAFGLRASMGRPRSSGRGRAARRRAGEHTTLVAVPSQEGGE